MDQELTHSSLEILFSISRELATSLDLRKVLGNVLTLSTENMNAERASLVVLDEFGDPMDAAIIYNGELIPHTVDQLRDVANNGLAGWVLKNRQPALINNTQQDARWLVRPNQELVDPARSALCVPLLAQDVLVGVLTIVHRNVDFFNPDQFALQKAIADMAGIAIRNAQLYQEIQNAHRRYHDLFENSIDPIFITTLEGIITEANQKAVSATATAKKDLLEQPILKLQEITEKTSHRLFEKIKKKESLIYETVLSCGELEKIPVEVHVSSISLQGNPAVQWIFHDITERKKLDSLRDDLSAMIYHDLRSPLSNIVSSLELIKGNAYYAKEPSLRQLVEICDRSTERVQRLISSLLDINRLEAGQPITNKQLTEVEKLVNDAIDIVLPVADSKEVVVEKMIFSRIPPIHVDPDMIRRVITNLLENAVKFSSSGDKVGIGAKVNGDQVALWVEDHGPGIPEESLDRIFNKFVRLNSDGVPKGLGLGLAFCRIAVQSHGGRIWVENITGGGSRFHLTLPVMKKD